MSMMAMPKNGDGITIPNLPFFPDVSTVAIREVVRVDATVTDKKFNAEVLAAMFQVNHELSIWRKKQIDAGYERMQDIPDEESIGNENRLCHLYQRAIAHATKAAILERYRDIDTPKTIDNTRQGEMLTEQIDECRRDSRWAIRDILGKSRATVALL